MYAIFCAIVVTLFSAIFVTLEFMIKFASVNWWRFHCNFCVICCHDIVEVLNIFET